MTSSTKVSGETMSATWVRCRLPLLCLLFAVAPAGCNSDLPPQASPDQARAALVTALDAWQKGETVESLAARESPIYFNDSKWQPDVRLVSYTVSEGHEMYGQSVRLTGTLTLKQPDGSTKERKFNYLIDTSPAIVIVPG
jgi:hypothetical protein